ncbi:hypothetical protein RchiOBHm_Chr5g0038631 [Rosa chinensis]|uniref:Uncharacterized protein n=1 Tax=Rosa chinensis TaxID=74649 RepID=A0A2P6QC31_ROSCH|nr:hypothetical protein RchiOBHm_Chr5g0038631 [Rosa chinensis]
MMSTVSILSMCWLSPFIFIFCGTKFICIGITCSEFSLSRLLDFSLMEFVCLV